MVFISPVVGGTMAFITPLVGGTMAFISPVVGGTMVFITPVVGGTINEKVVEYPLIASVEINRDCNLSCDHCFISKREEGKEALSEGELEKAISGLVDNGINIVTLAGKEIFFDNKGINLLRFLDSVKKEKGVSYGFITNGYNLGKFLGELSGLSFDWMDISLDSYDKEKSFKQNAEVIKKIRADKSLLERLTISSLATNENLNDLYGLSLHLDEAGIKRQTINPILDGNQNSLIPHERFISLFENYRNASEFGNLEVSFVVVSERDKGWIKSNYKLTEKFIGMFEQDTYKVKEKIFVLFPNPKRYMRLTVDGYVLKGKDILQPSYQDFAVGNIREDNLKDLVIKAFPKKH